MPVRFTVLASGSSGNASLLEADGFGLLIDAGLGPRQIASRLEVVGASWESIDAVVLTHTHRDHWRNRTLKYLLKRQIPLYCHPAHIRHLRSRSALWPDLQAARLLREYQPEGDLGLSSDLRCRPFALRHDGGPTFGFRIERGGDLFSPPWALGYASDLGTWDASIAGRLGDVDLLALEFNHDVQLQRSSGRTARLIARVLGDEGHLSNDQAASLLHDAISQSRPDRLRHVVQLHLSRQCNRPDLASDAARRVLNGRAAGVRVHTARQDRPIQVPGIDSACKPGSRDMAETIDSGRGVRGSRAL